MQILEEYHLTEVTSLQMAEVDGNHYVYWYNSNTGQVRAINHDKPNTGWKTGTLNSAGIKWVATARPIVQSTCLFSRLMISFKKNAQFDRDHNSEKHLST